MNPYNNTGFLISVEKMRKHRPLARKHEGKDQQGDLGLNERMILKWT
jgi:hypothetical protein